MRESGVGPNGTESPGGESERSNGQHSTAFAEDDEEEPAVGRLNLLDQRNAGAAKWTWEKSHLCGRLGNSGERDAESMFPEISTQEREGVHRTRRRAHQYRWTAGHALWNS